MKRHIAIPYFPPFIFLLSDKWGGGRGMGPCAPLSYANDSDEAMICQRGQSEGAKRPSGGGGGGRGFPPPTGGRFLKIKFFAH